MKKFLFCLLIATITGCSTNEKSSNETKDIDINEARAACEKLDILYNTIYADWLKRNNIKYEKTDDGIAFDYQNGHFFITDNSNDKEYFQLIMPNILHIDDNIDLGDVMTGILTVNKESKCVKCIIVEQNIWLSTEILLDQTPEIEVIMPRLLSMLHGARIKFHSKIKQ